MGNVIAKNLMLFNLRKMREWDQVDVAAKLGIPVNYYADIEKGKSQSKPSVWVKIQNLYEIPDEDMWKLIKGSM
jgi:transcriptional regulator with XRE-family HTH domain